MTVNETIEFEYPELIRAAKKITGGHALHMDLLHYSIEELYNKPNMTDIVHSGGLRFYLVRIMMTQWRSRTGPFFKQFGDHYHKELNDNLREEETEHLDTDRVHRLLEDLTWYDRLLFQTFMDGNHTYSSLSRETGIPRTSISLTINRVRDYIKSNLYT
jgi:DNA-directed RNA polymerase specialized sigma24 family protein